MARCSGFASGGNGFSAALCFGVSWVLATAVLIFFTQGHVPPAIRSAVPTREPRAWMRGALSMATGSLMLTMLARRA